MNDEPAGFSAAEARLVGLLVLLRDEPGADEMVSARRVMRAVRLQYVLRGLMATVGGLAAALVDGLTLVLGLGGRPGRR